MPLTIRSNKKIGIELWLRMSEDGESLTLKKRADKDV
jgi:hypothetical protein